MHQTTPQLVRKFAALRARLAVLSERRVTGTPTITGRGPLSETHPTVRRMHDELDSIVDELRKRGVLD